MQNPLANLQQFDIAGNAQNALLQGMQVGDALRQRKQQEQLQQATQSAYRGAYNGDMSGVNALADLDAQKAFEIRGSIQSQQASQMEAERKRLAQVADLLDNSTDEVSYQRNLAVARQLGLPVDSAPPNFDPEFVATQTAIARAILGNDPKLTEVAQDLVAAGYQPGSPEFQNEYKRILAAKFDTKKTLSYQQGGGAVAYDTVTGQITPLIVPGGSEQSAGIPPEAIAELRSNPGTAAQFDEIFGQGAAARALGGGGGNVTSGF